MKDSWIGQVGIRGQRHYHYLKESKPTVVNVMRMNGNLKSYLREVDEQAEEMIFQLVRQNMSCSFISRMYIAAFQCKIYIQPIRSSSVCCRPFFLHL